MLASAVPAPGRGHYSVQRVVAGRGAEGAQGVHLGGGARRVAGVDDIACLVVDGRDRVVQGVGHRRLAVQPVVAGAGVVAAGVGLIGQVAGRVVLVGRRVAGEVGGRETVFASSSPSLFIL